MSHPMENQAPAWVGNFPQRLAMYVGATAFGALAGAVIASFQPFEVVLVVIATLVLMLPAMAVAAFIAGGSRLTALIAAGFFGSTLLAWLVFAVSGYSSGLVLILVPILALVASLLLLYGHRTTGRELPAAPASN